MSVWLFSNSGNKVQILVESMGQICPLVLHLFWTLSLGFDNNLIFQCSSGIFPTILTYMNMLKNCQNNISVYDCSPTQGTKFYSWWNLMKQGSQSGTYIYIYVHICKHVCLNGSSYCATKCFLFVCTEMYLWLRSWTQNIISGLKLDSECSPGRTLLVKCNFWLGNKKYERVDSFSHVAFVWLIFKY